MRTVFLLLFAIAAPAQSLRPGLVAAYDDGKTSVRAIAAAPEFYLEAGESVHPALLPAFQAHWTGVLSVIAAGEYTFDAGPAAVTIDGTATAGKPVRLSSGQHAIDIRYRRAPGTAAVRLVWKSAQFPAEPVPASVLFHSASDTVVDPVEQGRHLVEELGCVNCHRAASSSLVGRMGPDLSAIGARVTPEWLVKWLESPAAFRPGAVMPAVADPQHRADIARYLASLGATAKPRERAPNGVDVGAGASLFGAIGCAVCHRRPGLGLEGMGSKTSATALAAYLQDPARIDPGGRMPSLMLTAREAAQLSVYLVESRNPAFEQSWTGGDTARGRELTATQGCLACHAVQGAANRQTAPALDKLPRDRGCLSANPSSVVPHYQLTAGQRSALNAFLDWYRAHPDISPAPVYELGVRMRQFRCDACHQLDAAPLAMPTSEATPPLTHAGAKLQTPWLQRVLTGRARVRTWQDLRMPDYDSKHVGHLAAAFAKSAGVAPGMGEAPPGVPEARRTQGVGFIGTDPRTKGMGCIGCHDWGKNKALGEEAPQLIQTAERLRFDWYDRWMRNPGRILSGTSMPNYFSSMTPAAANEIITSLWAAMSLGDRMPVPAGFTGIDSNDAESKPVPGKLPIVVRWDMPEATPAAIAVGLPGGLSYCFDAGESRLRYAWRGGFIDLSETLTKKTEANKLTPTAKLIGDVFYRSDDFPFRSGAADRVPVPRFRGYRLVDGFPEFRYEIEGVEVSERIKPGAGRGVLTRQFTLNRVAGPMWFQDGPRRVEIQRGENVRFTVEVGER